MSKNKLYTCSYFCKRIIESGFDVIRLSIPYEPDDQRKWTIVVNKHGPYPKMNVIITCFKNDETKEFAFKFQGRKKKEFLLETLTMNMIIGILTKAMEVEQEIGAGTEEAPND